MHHLNPYISYFAKVDWREDSSLFGILQHDRMVGMYLLGKTGAGKTNLLETLMYQDIVHGRGMCVLDVNGDMVKKVMQTIPPHRKHDVIYLDTSNPDLTWGYNPLKKVSFQHRHLIASHIIETFQKLWGQQAWGVKLEHILRNVILTLLDQPKTSFSDIIKILTDDVFRMRCMENVVTEEVKNFWKNEFSKFSKSDILPVLNKVGSFVSIPTIKKILVDNKRQLSFNTVLNENKILLVNLSKGTLGSDASHLLGSLLLNSISASGFHRVRIPEQERKDFYVYLDEFQNFTTLTLVNMFSELRKFKVGFILAHQYLNQLAPKIKDAVLGNIGTVICYRISYQDAKYMAQEFYPVFTAHDFISLENFHIYLRLMIDGKPSKPFSAITIPSNWFIQPKD